MEKLIQNSRKRVSCLRARGEKLYRKERNQKIRKRRRIRRRLRNNPNLNKLKSSSRNIRMSNSKNLRKRKQTNQKVPVKVKEKTVNPNTAKRKRVQAKIQRIKSNKKMKTIVRCGWSTKITNHKQKTINDKSLIVIENKSIK